MNKATILQLIDRAPRREETQTKYTRNEYKRLAILCGIIKWLIKLLLIVYDNDASRINFKSCMEYINEQVTYQTVLNTLGKLLSHGTIEENERKNESRKLIPEHLKEDIELYIDSNNGEVYLKDIILEFQLDCEEKTIANYLWKELKIGAFRKIRGCKLYTHHKITRFEYARSKLPCTFDYWKYCFFGDEAWFEIINDKAGQQHVWRRQGDYNNDKYFRGETQRLQGIMAYLCICFDGPKFIYFFPQGSTVTSNTYMRSVVPKIQRAIVNHWTEEDILNNINYHFIDDNARVHSTDNAIEFTVGNGIDTHFWPARSPDLSPIEGCIGQVKEAVWERRYEYGTRMDDFKVFIVN